MNDPLGLFSTDKDPLGLFSKPKEGVLPNPMNQNEIPTDVQFGRKYDASPKETTLLEDNINAYREWLGLKSAAHNTAAGLVAFPTGLVSGSVKGLTSGKSLKETDTQVGKDIESIQKTLNTNNIFPDTADKYNKAVGETINQVLLPLSGVHLGVPQPFRKGKIVEPPKPILDAQIKPPITESPFQSSPVPESFEFVKDPNVIDGRYVRAELPELPPKLETVDPGSLAADSILARGRQERPLETIDPGHQEILNALKKELGDDFVASHDAALVEKLRNEMEAREQLQKRGQMEGMWNERETGIEQRATRRLADEARLDDLTSLEQELSQERQSKGQQRKANFSRSSRFGGGQRGAINIPEIMLAIEDFKSGVRGAFDVLTAYKGTFSPNELQFMWEHINSPKSRTAVVLMSPDEFHSLAAKRDKTYLNNSSRAYGPELKRMGVREGLKSNNGLSDIPWLTTKTTDGIAEVTGHEGRHRMDVFKEMGIDKVPVLIRDSSVRWGEDKNDYNPEPPIKIKGEDGNIILDIPEILNKKYDSQGRVRVSGPQRGAIDSDFLTFGLASKLGKYLEKKQNEFPVAPEIKTEVVDSIQHPISEQTITEKATIRNKTNASAILKKIAPEYSSVTTPEEALSLAKNTKDINYNPVRDATIAGINGQVFLHRNNPLINMTRYVLQEARNVATKFSRDFITGKDGTATLLGKLSDNDLIITMEHLDEASRKRLEFSKENLEALPISQAAKDAILSVRKAFDAQYVLASTRGRMEVGREPFIKLPGYLPGIMNKGYKSLVGVMKDGIFQVKGIAQTSTRWKHKAEVEAMKELVGEGAVVVPLPRVSLKQAFYKNGMFNGFNELLATIAKHDPRFEQLQQLAQMKGEEATHQWMNFNIHELNKKGIRGTVGDSFTQTRLGNAKDLRQALIDNLEQGASYYAHQKAASDIHQIIYSPDTAHLPNTRELIKKHLDHVEGRNINALGSFVNSSVDLFANIAGVDGRIPLSVAREMRTLVGLHMMSIWNPAFTALQFTQLLTGAYPEMVKVGEKLGIMHEINSSAANVPLQLAALSIAKRAGKEAPGVVPDHLREAFQYAQDNGIMSFSELENAQKASRNKYVRKAENLAAWNIVLGEKGTRPVVFMTFADIFHKFGLDNAEAFMAAQHTTNLAMGDYHMAERPQIYASLGVLGEFGGALTTYKHNALTNLYIRNKDFWKKDKEGHRMLFPAAAALAGLALFQGIKGSPGYDEMDALYQLATSWMGERHSIAEDALQNAPEWASSGVLSATTGLDFQSRASMAKIAPDMAWSSLSPQAGVLGDIGLKAYQYWKFKDEQSWNDLKRALAPGGLKGMVEDVQEGWSYNSAGELIPEQPRTETQQTIRKWTGIRPLKETKDSKDVYVRSKSLSEQENALQEIAIRYRQAFASGDMKGMDNLKDKYLAKGGDPQVLDNPDMLREQIVRSNQSQRDRYAGQPAANMQSIRRQERMYPTH